MVMNAESGTKTPKQRVAFPPDIRAFRTAGDIHVPVEALAYYDPAIRTRAARALAKFVIASPSAAEGALGALSAALAEPDESVQKRMVGAVRRIGDVVLPSPLLILFSSSLRSELQDQWSRAHSGDAQPISSMIVSTMSGTAAATLGVIASEKSTIFSAWMA